MRKIFLIFILCSSLNVYAQQQTDTINIFFDIDSSVVDNKNVRPLIKLIVNPNIASVSIYGYADFLGNAAYNQYLSEKRSENVRNYLISKGIKKENIDLQRLCCFPQKIPRKQQIRSRPE